MAGLLPFSSPRSAQQTSPRPGLPFIVGGGQEGAACSGGRVLRARTPDGIEQEVYALLVTYQALRTAIADAASTVPGIDPDRASFTVALGAARDQVTPAAIDIAILAPP